MKIEERSDIHAINARDEYLDQKLRTAARIVWLGEREFCGEAPLEPSPDWLALASAQLLTVLRGGALPGGTPRDEIAIMRHALKLLGIDRTYGASSARVETIPTPTPEEQAIESWHLASVGQA